MAYIQKPLDGKYTITINSTEVKNSNLEVYLYDKDGNVEVKNFPFILSSNMPTTVSIKFDSKNISRSKMYKKMTFDLLISDIRDLTFQNLVDHRAADKLILFIENIEKHYANKSDLSTEFLLKIAKESLRFYNKELLSRNAYRIISEDIEDLIESL